MNVKERDRCWLCHHGFRKGESKITVNLARILYKSGFEGGIEFLGEYHFRCAIELDLIEWNKRNSPIPHERVQLKKKYDLRWAEKEFGLKKKMKHIQKMKLTPHERELEEFHLEINYSAFLNRSFDFNRLCMNCGTHLHKGDHILTIQLWGANKTLHASGHYARLEVLCIDCAETVRPRWIHKTQLYHANFRTHPASITKA